MPALLNQAPVAQTPDSGRPWVANEVVEDTAPIITVVPTADIQDADGNELKAGETYLMRPSALPYTLSADVQLDIPNMKRVNVSEGGGTTYTVASAGTVSYDLLNFPPAQPVNAPAGPTSGDTHKERYQNGTADFTHNGTNWSLTLFTSSDDRKFTVRRENGVTYTEGSLAGPQNPPTNPGNLDVHLEVYDNALVYFNYLASGPAAGWDGNNVVFVPLTDTYNNSLLEFFRVEFQDSNTVDVLNYVDQHGVGVLLQDINSNNSFMNGNVFDIPGSDFRLKFEIRKESNGNSILIDLRRESDNALTRLTFNPTSGLGSFNANGIVTSVIDNGPCWIVDVTYTIPVSGNHRMVLSPDFGAGEAQNVFYSFEKFHESGLADVNRERWEVTERNVNGQSAGDDIFPFEIARLKQTHYSRLVEYNYNGTWTVSTGIHPVKVILNAHTIGTTGTAQRVSYIKETGAAPGVRLAESVDGVFGEAVPDVPATAIVPANTTITLEGRSVSSGNNQALEVGASMEFIELTAETESQPVCDILDYTQLTDIAPTLTAAIDATAQVAGRIKDDDTPIEWNPATSGASDTKIVEVITSSGITMPVAIKVTQQNGGAGAAIMTMSNTTQGGGRFFFGNQNRDLEITVTVLDDINGNPYTGRIALHAASLGSTEGLTFIAQNPVTDFAGGAGGQDISGALPFSGDWHNNNNNATSGFGFGSGNQIVFRKNNTSAAGANLIISLRDEPASMTPADSCEVTKALSTRIGQLSAPQPETVVHGATGIYHVATHTPATPLNLTGTDQSIVTGFDLTQPGDYRISFEVTDGGGSTREWSTSPLRVEKMVERFNAGDTIDGYVHVFENDFIVVNIANPSTGELLLRQSGRDVGINSVDLYLHANGETNGLTAIPSSIALPFTPAVTGAGGVGAGEPANPVHGYMMYIAESISTDVRFAGASNIANTQERHFVGVWWDGSAWRYSDNGENGTTANWLTFTPLPTDILMAKTTFGNINQASGDGPFSENGKTHGIWHVKNYGGATDVIGNQFTNGSANSGEFYIDGVANFSAITPESETATLQLDGNYRLDSDGTTIVTVADAIANGWKPFDGDDFDGDAGDQFIQTGFFDSAGLTGTQTLTLPEPFANADWHLFVTMRTNTSNRVNELDLGNRTASTTEVAGYEEDGTPVVAGSWNFQWMAVGQKA